CTRVWDSFDYW
nr:immunoglobulin heavy chain junction region [Mus musculus]